MRSKKLFALGFVSCNKFCNRIIEADNPEEVSQILNGITFDRSNIF